MREKVICGLDVGSSKVCAVIAGFLPAEKQLNILGVGEERCSGLKHGVVVNIENTCRAISQAVEKAEQEAEVKVKDVIVNINGHHIEGHMHQGATKIPRADREITSEDIERVINSARAVPLSSDRQIIHAIPLDFKVDNQAGVENPAGMEGSHLEVDVMLITGDCAPMNNLDKCITRSGLGIKRTVSTLLAPTCTVVASEEKELGCILVDIGAQTINMAIFVGGALKYIGEIDMGSDYITYDLAYGLKTSFNEAKRIKEDFGCAVTDNILETEIKYVGVDGQSSHKTTNKEVNKIIEPRVDDIIDLIAEEIASSGHQQMVPSGIILSGGGSELKGLDEAIRRKISNFQVRLGRPRNIKGKEDRANSPKYATAVGLMEYIMNLDKEPWMSDVSHASHGGFWDKLKAWFEEVF
ncbi:MAG: cell division protein FtsA [Elusimicrobia bacterium]|nr:cell division protein FtsA [Elusimicrobiota bacterium]